MSVGSLYESGDDECELFRIIDPEHHPDADDDTTSIQEEAHLSRDDYQERQEAIDEQSATSSNSPTEWDQLTPAQRAAVERFIQDLINYG